MYFRFFSKTDTTPRKRFFNPKDIVAGSADGDQTGIDRASPFDKTDNISYRKLRFLAPQYLLEEILEKLLRNAESFDGNARTHFLEKMLNLLKKYPDLVNRVPNKFHSNPLELVIKIGDMTIVQELLKLNATVRPENSHLLKRIEKLLHPKLSNMQSRY